MSRPLRIECPGALYHVTARGDRREAIFEDDADRIAFLAVIAQAFLRFDARMLAYCLMGNHYHLVLQTRSANLSQLMRHVNGVYSQRFNRRHDVVGHLLQGRFKAILVNRDAYLLEVCRYVDLNPVRAALVEDPADWPWSSYRSHVVRAEVPAWLDTSELHGHLLGREVRTTADTRRAAKKYTQWVAAGRGVELWDLALNRQVYLGDDDFVERMQDLSKPSSKTDRNIPATQRAAPRTLSYWMRECSSREAALWMAHARSGLSMTALAAEIGLSVGRVSQLIAKAEAEAEAAAAQD